MMAFGASPKFSSVVRTASHVLMRAFPTPALLMPPVAGIDISDTSIKWLVLERRDDGLRVEHEGDGLQVASFGEAVLEEGVIVNGTVKSAEKLGETLAEVRRHLGDVRFAHTALPEEAAYVFEMHVPEGTPRSEVRSLIEFEFEGRVPIAPEAAVFDFDIIEKSDDGEGEDIGVSVFPRDLAESYMDAFARSGITLLSLELEARSIARAVIKENDPVTLLVDFGRARTGFAVLKRGIPIFTSTVEVGGNAITRALMETMSISEEEAIRFRNEQGLAAPKDAASKGLDAVAPVASALADEVARHYHYWDTRRNDRGERVTPVSKVVLVGGSANLKGLPDYVAGRVQAPAVIGDVWSSVFPSHRDVPPIDKRASLQYATAIGLALRSFAI